MRDTIAAARERWRKDGAKEHVARCFALLDRMDASQQIATDGWGGWTRYDANVDAQRSGKTSTGAARRATGRKTQDEREYQFRLTILLEDFGMTEGQVLGLYAQQGDESFSPESFDPDQMPEAAVMPQAAPQPRRGKRDRLAWVAVMRSLATTYAAQRAK